MYKMFGLVKRPASIRLASALLALALAACGRTAQVSSDAQTTGVTMTAGEVRSLQKIESAVSTATNAQMCVSSRSPYYNDTAGLVNQINPVLGKMQNVSPPVWEAIIMDFPPRVDGTIAVFLCDGMTQGAETLFRTVSLSNQFISDLKSAVATAGADASAFNSALAFVLYHEMGHAVLNHSAVKLRGNQTGFGLPQEMAADQFAIDTMTSLGIALNGVDIARAVAGSAP
ncbi:MAG: hypothetical protein HY280_11370 [Nitrospinae bacterium]|nr:hypothetical protein [Nitrospinota bacterium]